MSKLQEDNGRFGQAVSPRPVPAHFLVCLFPGDKYVTIRGWTVMSGEMSRQVRVYTNTLEPCNDSNSSNKAMINIRHSNQSTGSVMDPDLPLSVEREERDLVILFRHRPRNIQ